MITTKELPILFSTPMVRAILSGRKTQTRRIIKPQTATPAKQPWHVGSSLWVRETWGIGHGDNYLYAADYDPHSHPVGLVGNWKPSIHMPRKASRITLEIADVRIERLQDISEQDSICEGIEPMDSDGTNKYTIHIPSHHASYNAPTAKGVFVRLWESINGDDSWDVNPWVWVISFTKK